MRTSQEIADRMEWEKRQNEFMNFALDDLLAYLTDFELAKKYLKAGVTAEEWVQAVGELVDPLQAVREYMPFAWEKANSCRGISASRSMDHMRAWLWLAGEDELLGKIEQLLNHSYYGKPHLRKICEHLGIDWRALDDGKWRNREDGPYFYADVIS